MRSTALATGCLDRQGRQARLQLSGRLQSASFKPNAEFRKTAVRDFQSVRIVAVLDWQTKFGIDNIRTVIVNSHTQGMSSSGWPLKSAPFRENGVRCSRGGTMSIHVGKVLKAGNRGKRSNLVSLLAAGAFVLAACGSSSPAASSTAKSSSTSGGSSGSSPTTSSAPIKIGVMTNDTGTYAALGTPLRDAAQMVFDQINQSGGINGHQIQGIFMDGQTNPNLAVTQAHQLVSDGVAAVLGLEFGTAAHAVAPVFEAAHIPVITNTADETITSPVNPWVFDLSTTTRYSDQRYLSYFACKGITKVAVLHDNEALGQQGNADLISQAAKYGVSIVGNQTYDLTGTNFETQLLALNSTPAQAIVYWGVGTAPVVIVKEHAALGIKAPLVGSAANTDQSFLSQVPGAVNGMLDGTVPADLLKHLPASVTDGATIQSFATSFTSTFNIPFGLFASFGHDDASIIASVVKDGATTPAAIQAKLNNFTVNSFMGTIKWTPTNHTGVQLSDEIMARIVNGEAVPTKCQ